MLMTTHAGVGMSRHHNPNVAGREAAEQALQKAGVDEPDFSFMFASIGYDQHSLLRAVRETTGGAPLRRVMCNDLDQKVRQVTQRSADGTVDPLSAGVGRDFGGQSCQQPSQGLGSVAFEPEEILELPDHPFHYLALAGGPEIGRASCRERVYISVVAVSLKKKKTKNKQNVNNKKKNNRKQQKNTKKQ